MCDMRSNPTGIEYYNGIREKVSIVGCINLTTYPAEDYGFIKIPIYKGFNDPSIHLKGIYTTIATGGGYYFFDGTSFRSEWYEEWQGFQSKENSIKILFGPETYNLLQDVKPYGIKNDRTI